jgi:2'-hydroxyisoflavone reductase
MLQAMNRRRFIRTSAVSSLALLSSRGFIESVLASTSKRVLVFGGTNFVGPAVVEALLIDGHRVTLFNRGMTNTELFSHVEKLKGFRSPDQKDQDLSALEHRHFDVVIDIWPNEPEVVASAAEFLKNRTNHYLFVSSVGAYDRKLFPKPDVITEDAPTQPWNDERAPQYNRNKAESERRLHQIIGERLTIVRPTRIKGHLDDSNPGNLLTWLLRMQTGGEHIGPGDGKDPFQLVDVKDVARFLTLAITKLLYGTFNLTGKLLTFRDYLEECKAATHSDATLTWIPQQFLHEHGLEPDSALHTRAGYFPSWTPEVQDQGICRVSSERAFRSGWEIRPFEETAFDCLLDFRSGRLEPSTLLTPAKEKEVLEAWKHRAS